MSFKNNSKNNLWAALFFPQLAIDMHAQVETEPEHPVAVIIQEGARKLVMSSNNSARDVGIHPGLTLNGAYVMAPDLYIIEYDEQVQNKHLEHICLWAMQYSSWVTPRAPNSILIEIRASLKLFGGIDSLVSLLRADCRTQGLQMQLGIAPTPTAASLFSHMGDNTQVTTPEQLDQILQDIPTEYLPFDDFTKKGLRQSGIKSCKQLFALPAAALTRRFGPSSTELIYKLSGRLPDICKAFTTPNSFYQSLDLPLEAPNASALQFPLNRIMSSLGGFLKKSDLGVKSLTVTLRHHHASPTHLTVTFLEATADQKHIFRVISERLENTTLIQPAISISVTTMELGAITHDDRDLFQKNLSQANSIQSLLDNLSARLGSNKLYTPLLADDHRPEKAWYSSLLADNSPPESWPARPLWLLKHPEPAKRRLTIQSTAERIENGWWSDPDVRRDYYLATDYAGTHYWVFTDRSAPDTLFVHGIFS